MRPAFFIKAFAVAGVALIALAAWPQSNSQRPAVGVQERTTQIGTSAQAPTQQGNTRQDAADQLTAQIWGLSSEEVQRAKVLLAGPRASFSVPNLSPIEALGIHARNDAERRKYAELFAKAVQSDVERSLAWNKAFEEAQHRLYGVQSVVSFAGLPKVVAPVGAADIANVPRDLVIDPAPSAKQKGTRVPAKTN